MVCAGLILCEIECFDWKHLRLAETSHTCFVGRIILLGCKPVVLVCNVHALVMVANVAAS